MILFETIAVAFGMFSAFPVPKTEWNARNMRYSLCAFPPVGAVIGVLWAAAALLSERLGLPELCRAAVLTALPALSTGGIHLDGYIDTSDALASWGDAAKKRTILKDSHIGAFALIRTAVYFTVYLGACSAFRADARGLVCMGLGFVLERALSGAAIAGFPIAADTGLAHTFASSSDRRTCRRVLAGISACCVLGMTAADPLRGPGMALAAGFVFWDYRRTAVREFGGITGDLAGWFLQRAELYMLCAAALLPYAAEALAGK